jgi:hypothetical protein
MHYLAILCLVLVTGVLAQDPVPGVQMGLGAGYDVKIERIRMPLYQYHYTYGQTWKNPYTDTVYSVPDELFLTEIPKGKIVKVLNTFSEFHELITSLTESIGLDVNVGYKGVNADVNFQRSHGHFNDLVRGGVNNFGMENRYLPFYQLDVWPDSEFNAHIKAMINSLPNTIVTADDQAKYNTFISAVGTHYCVSAQFGGFLNFSSIFKTSMYKEHTQDWVAYQIKLSVSWQEIKVGIDWNRNKSMDKMDQTYAENSFNESDCVGGLCAYLAEDCGYDKWVESVMKEPGMLPAYMIMYPITDLIVDNPTKKQTLENVVIKYLNSNVTLTN